MKHQLFWGWICVSSFIAFVLFGYDKLRASRFPDRRVSEFHLVLIGAAGGWPGGLLGMLLFRHKTSKRSFKIKYAISFVVWASLLLAAWKCLSA